MVTIHTKPPPLSLGVGMCLTTSVGMCPKKNIPTMNVIHGDVFVKNLYYWCMMVYYIHIPIYWVVMVMCPFFFKNYIYCPLVCVFRNSCFTLCQEAISIKDGRPGHFGIAGRWPYRISVSNCLNQRSKMSKVSWFCKGCLSRIHNQLFVNQSLLIIEVKTGMQIKHPCHLLAPPPDPKYCWKTLRIKDLASNS